MNHAFRPSSRRSFLRLGTAGPLGLSLADFLRLESRAAAPSPKAKSVILVWLSGGPSTIDMWDLKPDAPEAIRGEFKPIPTSLDGLQVCEHLPLLAKVMDRCTLVRSLHHTIPSHGPGTVTMHSGYKPSPALEYPSLGSIAAKLLPAPPGVPPYVTFGQNRDSASLAGYLGSSCNPFEVEGNPGKGDLRVRGLSLPKDLSLAQLEQRKSLLEHFDKRFDARETRGGLAAPLDAFQEQAVEMLRAEGTKTAFDLTREPDAVKERYGRDDLGQGALVARRLVEAGVRFVSIGKGGWDTHNDNFKSLRDSRLPSLDRALSALLEDLDQRGLLGRTIVYCAGEFGRTPKVNDKGGRDHWAKSMAVLLAGGGFRRGAVYGATDRDGMAPDQDPCTPADLCATILHNLGIDPALELTTPSGRPVSLFRGANVLTGTLA
jgi:hypothetical protein